VRDSPSSPYRYVSDDEDSARWIGFLFRQGDIVISTRSKSGTTWMQMICAVLVLGTPDLPRPLADLSPWLDTLTAPRDEVYAMLEAQQHRRFIKTHTPLDGIPLDPRATYVVVARHPLDMAVSLYHQGNNINRERLRELAGAGALEPSEPTKQRPPVREWLLEWTRSKEDPREAMDSLPGVMWHLSDAWARRNQPNIVLVHYDDLSADLDGEMRRLANRLGVAVSDKGFPDLVQAATFEQMKGKADYLLPNRTGVLKDANAFFRKGRSGSGKQLLSDAELAAYRARTAELAPPDLLAWLHRD
jgi:aryl sulfotransferase